MYIKLSKIISIMCALCVLVGSNIVSAQDNGSERQYVIITKDADKTEDLINDKKIEDVSKSDKTPDIIVANLTERQADRIEDKDYVVCVEEDIVLTGSTAKNIKKKKTNVIKTEDVNQWYLDAIGVENTQKPRSKVKVALLDSGVSYSSDVDVEESINLVDDTSVNPLFLDASGHGTALASVLCAKDNNEGVTGVNPNMELYSAKVLDDNNQASLSKIIESIYWAIENGVDIINMSFGTTVNSQALHNAIKEAAKKDILMIAAAGNTKHQAVQYPAAYNEVVAVGSTDANGELAELTSTGTELELLAPGEKIIANDFLSFLTVTSGTSIATAQVTGVASLLLQKDTTKSSDFIRRLLKTSAKEVNYGINRTAGLVDYSYANDIYNEFAMKYKLGSFNTVNLENTETPEDYTTDTKDITVDGLWSSSINVAKGHYKTAEQSTANEVSDSKLKQTIIKAACWADSDYKNGTRISEQLHGSGNYIAKLKYLYFLQYYLLNGKSYVTSNSLALNQLSSLTGKDKTKLENLAREVDIACNPQKQSQPEDYLMFRNTVSYENNRVVKRGKVIGFAIHLIGDLFAHRTIVPTSAIDCSAAGVTKTDTTFGYGDFPTYYGPQFSEAELREAATSPTEKIWDIKNNYSTKLRCWDAMKFGVLNYQIIEFRDIKYFQNEWKTSLYEDDANFFKERYNQSLEICEQYILDVIYNYKANVDQNTGKPYFDLGVMQITRRNLKLNNLKNYYINAGERAYLDMYTSSGWAMHSTSEYV